MISAIRRGGLIVVTIAAWCISSAPVSADHRPLDAAATDVPYGFNDGWGQMPFAESSVFIDQAAPVIDDATGTSRLFVKWDQVQRCPNGPYDWTAGGANNPEANNPEATYHRLLNHGIQPILMIYDAPQWAAPLGLPVCSDPNNAVWHPRADQLGAWAQFVEAAARKFPAVRAIEIWNEPNLQGFWGGGIFRPDPHEYSAMLKVAGERIKSLPSPPDVLLGGLWISDTGYTEDEYLDLVYTRSGIKNAFDGIAIHPYPTCEPYTPAICAERMWERFDRDGQGTQRDLTDVRNSNGDSSTPFWITETGLSDASPGDQQMQASALVAMYGSLVDHLAPADPAADPTIESFVIHSFRDLSGEQTPWDKMGIVSGSACARKVAYGEIWREFNLRQEGYPGDAEVLSHNLPSYC